MAASKGLTVNYAMEAWMALRKSEADLYQQYSLVQLYPSEDIWRSLETLLVVISCDNRGGMGSTNGIWWVEARDASKYSAMPGIDPTIKNYAPTVPVVPRLRNFDL